MNLSEDLKTAYVRKYRKCLRLLIAMFIGAFFIAALGLFYLFDNNLSSTPVFYVVLLSGLIIAIPGLVYSLYLSILHWKDFTDHEEGRRILIGWFVASVVVIGIPLIIPVLMLYLIIRVLPDLRKLQAAMAAHQDQDPTAGSAGVDS